MISAFVRRDIKVRYAQTSMGVLWLIIQPLAYLLAFIFVFRRVFETEETTVPYSLFAVTGLMVWTYFSFSATQTGSSLIGSQEIIKKVYFPKLIIPIAKSIIGFLDLLVVLVIIGILLPFFNLSVSTNILWLPLILAFLVLFGFGVGALISAISIRYRDVQHLVPFIVQLSLFLSPVVYPVQFITDRLPDSLHLIYYINPLSGLIAAVRWSILGNEMDMAGVILSLLVIVSLLFVSLAYFTRVEGKLSDEL